MLLFFAKIKPLALNLLEITNLILICEYFVRETHTKFPKFTGNCERNANKIAEFAKMLFAKREQNLQQLRK